MFRAMWWYMYPHLTYIVIRYFPFFHRTAIRFILILASLLFVVPQVYITADPKSERDCPRNLLMILVSCIMFSLCTICFTITFAIMEPIPLLIKMVFHGFGFASFILQCVIDGSVFHKGSYCASTVPTLHGYMLFLAVIGTIIMIFYLLLLPFWIFNTFIRPGSLYDAHKRAGVCWPLVNCCNCIWHI